MISKKRTDMITNITGNMDHIPFGVNTFEHLEEVNQKIHDVMHFDINQLLALQVLLNQNFKFDKALELVKKRSS
ncbi:hypothetical protein SAMN04487866_10910 [Thermoactinomyces sp. DSM 45891]|nr:hypothetical protein SAMN04487866_10910 [Thermoactinomyces sp. DSM 45891]